MFSHVFSNLSMHAGSLDMFRPNLYWNLTARKNQFSVPQYFFVPEN